MSYMLSNIGFAPELVAEVLAGNKTITYRLGEKYFRNLVEGTIVGAIDSSTDSVFARLKVTKLAKLAIKDGPLSQRGHEKYSSVNAMVGSMQKYYPHEKVTPESVLSVVHFNVIRL